MTEPVENDPFAGHGAVRELGRATDWSATPLGPVDDWSPTLRVTVRTCLDAPFPINLWCGPEKTLIYNDAYARVLGDKHPAMGKPGMEVWREIWTEIRPLFQQIEAGGPPVYAEDAPFLVRRSGADADLEGPNAWFTFSLSPVRDSQGEIVAMLNIVSDSTARILAEREAQLARARAERAEGRLIDVFTQAPAFMAVLRGPDHVFEYVNASYYKLVGQRELIGRPVRDALPEVRSQGFEELLDDVFRTGEPYVGRETPIMLAHGDGEKPKEHFVDFVYYPLTEADGTITGVVAHGSDVTEHVRSRREAQRARKEAEEASQAKSQFLANMSHEIRTPINAIMGYTELLELGTAGPINDKQREQLERVRTSSRHLLSLVNDILDVAKVEAGRMQVEIETVSVAETVSSAVALVRPQALERDIRLQDRCTADASTSFSGDENRVRQILVNLLSNAVKFTEPGGEVRVECGTTEDRDRGMDVDREGPLTYVHVTDTGIGIEPEEMERVFRPFTQVESGHTRTHDGTGLGLTISRHLARVMGGDLTVHSVPGEGSTFSLWLPSRPAPDTGSIAEDTGDAPPPGAAAVGEALQQRVMVVLDRYEERLRTDPRIPSTDDLARPDVQDHAASFLADISQSLISLEKGDAASARLLRDGSEIQRLIAELHGRQRAQLGWSSDELAREWAILVDEMEKAVRSGIPSHVDAAEAIALMARFVERARRISIRSHRHLRQTM